MYPPHPGVNHLPFVSRFPKRNSGTPGMSWVAYMWGEIANLRIFPYVDIHIMIGFLQCGQLGSRIGFWMAGGFDVLSMSVGISWLAQIIVRGSSMEVEGPNKRQITLRILTNKTGHSQVPGISIYWVA